jgi:hypothetical protein
MRINIGIASPGAGSGDAIGGFSFSYILKIGQLIISCCFRKKFILYPNGIEMYEMQSICAFEIHDICSAITAAHPTHPVLFGSLEEINVLGIGSAQKKRNHSR